MKKLITIVITVNILFLINCIGSNYPLTNSSSANLNLESINNVLIPNLTNYITLKCDFHIHTYYSDGTVSPSVRVDEAFNDNLHAIAITDHIDRPPHRSISRISHNQSYETALPRAIELGITLIKGIEITHSMPPGHFNAIFLSDADLLDNRNFMDIILSAKEQNAFIFWNHPSWESQQPGIVRWWPIHTILLEQNLFHGIEVANDITYSPEAHQWCLENNLTMLGTSDIHGPVSQLSSGQHRTITLVFSRNSSTEEIYDALMEGRTAVYFQNHIIGKEIYLKELFENSVKINVTKSGSTARIVIRNNSGLIFFLKKSIHDPRLTYLRNNIITPYIIHPYSTHTLLVRLTENITEGDVNIIITNLLIRPNTSMTYTIRI